MQKVLIAFLFTVAAVTWALPQSAAAQGAGPREIIHYQKNMLVNAVDIQAFSQELLSFRPDTISLEEMAEGDKPLLDRLKDAYPSQQYCHVKHLSGTAALSRWPMVEGTQTCFGGWGIAGFQVEMPEGRVWVLAAHIQFFMQGMRPEILRALIPQLKALRGPVILAGDFNSAPYFPSTLQLADAAGVTRIGRAQPTFDVTNWLAVPIDHIMATGGKGILMRRPKMNSDHYGIVARFTMDFDGGRPR